jgi:hypothetical protein
MIYPMQDLLAKAKHSPYYKATNNQIIDWANTLPIDVVQHRCLLAMALYACKFYRQWSVTVSEGDFLSIVFIAHTRALDSWDRFHPYSGWFGQYLRTACVNWLRQSKVIWIPQQITDKETLALFEASDPDATRNITEDGSYWDTLGVTDQCTIDQDMLADVQEMAPELYANAVEGVQLRALVRPGVKGYQSHQSIDKVIRAQKEKVRIKYFRR